MKVDAAFFGATSHGALDGEIGRVPLGPISTLAIVFFCLGQFWARCNLGQFWLAPLTSKM